MSNVIPFKSKSQTPPPKVRRLGQQRPLFFDRDEFSRLLAIYSGQVAKGQWRDYAIDFLPGQALFSIFRHAHEAPVLTVSKQLKPSGKDREFLLFAGPKRLARGEDLQALTPHIHEASARAQY